MNESGEVTFDAISVSYSFNMSLAVCSQSFFIVSGGTSRKHASHTSDATLDFSVEAKVRKLVKDCMKYGPRSTDSKVFRVHKLKRTCMCTKTGACLACTLQFSAPRMYTSVIVHRVCTLDSVHGMYPDSSRSRVAVKH